jgi:hypothetical protein
MLYPVHLQHRGVISRWNVVASSEKPFGLLGLWCELTLQIPLHLVQPSEPSDSQSSDDLTIRIMDLNHPNTVVTKPHVDPSALGLPTKSPTLGGKKTGLSL